MALRTLHLGVGGRGRWPLDLFPGRDDVRVVGLCDPDPEALAVAREKTGLTEADCFGDWREALARVDCDAAVVITPPQLHHPMCLEAVRAGRHVMVEKPFTMDLAAACEVVAVAETTGAKLLVCQQRRFEPALRTAVGLIAEGVLSRPESGLVTRFGRRPRVHHSGVQPHSYAWERGIHDVDDMWAVFAATPVSVAAHSFNPSWSPYAHGAGWTALYAFDNGAVCTLACSLMSHRRESDFRVDCAEGTLTLGKSLTLQRAAVDGSTPEPETLPLIEGPGGGTLLTERFVEWVKGGPEPEVGMHPNLQVVAMIEAAGVASDEGRVVDLQAYLAEHLAAARAAVGPA